VEAKKDTVEKVPEKKEEVAAVQTEEKKTEVKKVEPEPEPESTPTPTSSDTNESKGRKRDAIKNLFRRKKE